MYSYRIWKGFILDEYPSWPPVFGSLVIKHSLDLPPSAMVSCSLVYHPAIMIRIHHDQTYLRQIHLRLYVLKSDFIEEWDPCAGIH